MASVSKRQWRTPAGKLRSAWVVSYCDQAGKQRRSQFPSKRDADAERVRIEAAVSQGTHVPDGKTVSEAADSFLKYFEVLYKTGKKQRSTHCAYEQHVQHILKSDIANIPLARLTGADCTTFAEDLEKGLSGAMAFRVFGTLKTILGYSRRHQWILVDPTQGITVQRGDRPKVKIPSKLSLTRLLAAARKYDELIRDEEEENKKRAEAFVSSLLFGGLRMSELRGLPRSDVDVDGCRMTIKQRADRWRQIGKVKTEMSERTVPLPASAMAAIKTWMSAGPGSDEDLLFPNGKGKVEFYQNFYKRLWLPLMLLAGLAKKTIKVDEKGCEKVHIKPQFAMHALRHAAVSLWIEQGANPMKVQQWAGHSSVQFTLDVYGHLWADPVGDARIAEGAAQSLAERSGISPVAVLHRAHRHQAI
jgi:integrase